MRTLCLTVLFAVCAVTLVQSAVTGYQQYQSGGYNATNYHGKYKIGDKVFLQKQKDILKLFLYVNQPSYFKEFVEIYKSYSIENNVDNYYNAQYVKDFFAYYHHGNLPKGEIFSVFFQPHLKQAIALFKLFYHAKDWDTFYKTAVWARNYVNEGLFIYALSVAVVHRPDLYGIVLPPIYEIYPYYFFNSEVISKAQQYKQLYGGKHGTTPSYGPGYGYPYGGAYESDYKGFTVPANYSGWYLNVYPEQYLSYFTEDVGINAYYYYYNLYYPFWLNGEEYNLKYDNRGEQFYYRHQQLLARYYLERLSNNFGEIPLFDYDKPIEYGYYPSLVYPNGLAFPERPAYAKLFNNYYDYGQSYTYKGPYSFSYYKVQAYQQRIFDAIDSGYVYDKEGKSFDLFGSNGFENFANTVEGNPNSVNNNYYGALQVHARFLLGFSFVPLNNYSVAPSALQHFETSLRDPIFWSLYKKIGGIFNYYKSQLPSYSYNELYFPGVVVEGVEFDRLITYFDYFFSSLSNAVYVNEQEFESFFPVQAKQYRLNHKPFTYKIKVSSDKAADVVVSTFIGPKYDEYGRPIDINENKQNFVQFDKFVYNLQSGNNVIERNNFQNHYVADKTSFSDLYKNVASALSGDGQFHFSASDSYFGFPNRFLLPKGKVGGQTFQFYVIVNAYHPPQYQPIEGDYYYPKVGTGTLFVDNYPLGYPFDKNIDEFSFNVPNSYFQDIVVYHKKFQEFDYPNFPYYSNN